MSNEEDRNATGTTGAAGATQETTAPTGAGAGRGAVNGGGANATELEQAQARAGENWDKYLRARADLDNYQKRVQRDLAASIRYGKKDLLKRLILCIDNVERAIAGWKASGVDAKQVEGVEIIHRQLLTVLAADGVVPMEVVGKPFDPTLHDAVVAWENPDVKVETVSDELEKGYMYEGDVLRPAKVRVARPA